MLFFCVLKEISICEMKQDKKSEAKLTLEFNLEDNVGLWGTKKGSCGFGRNVCVFPTRAETTELISIK